MSCHYSCSSCSKPTYFDSCLSCQATRTLTSGVCYCSGSLKQLLQPLCFQSQDSKQQTAIKALFYISIIIYFVIIICFLIRYKLVLTKKIIDVCQVTALVTYMRWNFTTLGKSSLSVLDNFNFAFAYAYCNKAAPPLNCTGFENFIAPSIMVVVFLVLYFVAYSIVFFRQPDAVSFRSFHTQNFDNFLYLYLNFTLPLNTLTLCRLVSYSPWSLLLLLPFCMLYIYLCVRFYRIINSPFQTKLLYRSSHCTLYLYDQNYHVNYIDHLYSKVSFTVKSNFMLFELTFKMLWSVSVVISYGYRPALTGYVLMGLLWLQFLNLRVFCKYDNLKLVAYWVLDAVFVVMITTFWFDFFEQLAFWVTCGLLTALLGVFIYEMVVNKFEMKVENRVFSRGDEDEPEVIEEYKGNQHQSKPKSRTGSDLELLEM